MIYTIILLGLIIWCLWYSQFSPNINHLSGGELPETIIICDPAITDYDQSGDNDAEALNTCRLQPGIDYYGNTYKTLKLNNVNECCQACQTDQLCKSFTYDLNEQICRLKSTKPTNPSKCPTRTGGEPGGAPPPPLTPSF